MSSSSSSAIEPSGHVGRESPSRDRTAVHLRPVIGKTFPFGQTLEAIKTPVNFGAPSCLANPDTRWALLLAMMAIFLIAAHLSRVREQKLLSVPAVMST
jgi:hypothetical protein